MNKLEDLKETIFKNFKRSQKVKQSKKEQKSTGILQKHKKQSDEKKTSEAKAKYEKLFGPILFGSILFFVVVAIVLAAIPCKSGYRIVQQKTEE